MRRAFLLVWAVAACGRSPEKELVLAATGAWTDANTQSTRWGIELAIDDVNAANKGKGAVIKLITADDSGSGAVAARVASSLVANKDVVGVIGHLNSGPMVVAAGVYEGHLAAVSPSASSPDLTGISSWFFRTIPSDSANGAALARFAASLGQRAAVVYENDRYGRGLAESFRRSFPGAIVGIDPIDNTPADYSVLVRYLATQAKPDVVFVAGVDATGVALLREARKQNFHAHFVGGEGWLGITSDTAAAEASYIGIPFDASDPRPVAQAFVTAYRRKHENQTPDAYAALAYDAATVLARAALESGGARAKVRDYLANLRSAGGFAGVTGKIAFDAAGEPEGRFIMIARVHRGVLELVNAGTAK